VAPDAVDAAGDDCISVEEFDASGPRGLVFEDLAGLSFDDSNCTEDEIFRADFEALLGEGASDLDMEATSPSRHSSISVSQSNLSGVSGQAHNTHKKNGGMSAFVSSCYLSTTTPQCSFHNTHNHLLNTRNTATSDIWYIVGRESTLFY
jgi:hypothetical protein